MFENYFIGCWFTQYSNNMEMEMVMEMVMGMVIFYDKLIIPPFFFSCCDLKM